MSSSNERTEDSSNNQPRTADPPPDDALLLGGYYFSDGTNSNPTENSFYPPTHAHHGFGDNYTGQQYFGYYGNPYSGGQPYFPPTTNPGADTSEEIDKEFEEFLKGITDEIGDDNRENECDYPDVAHDEFVYSDAVQDAFVRYEIENAQYWNHNNRMPNKFQNDEEKEMLEQMDECMRFMETEYDKAQQDPQQYELNSMSKILEETTLNPNAVEFCPSSFLSASSSDQATVNTLSSTTSQDAIQNEKKDS